MLPDAVRHHARRQRILFARDDLRELQPSAAFLESLARGAGDDLRRLARNHRTFVAGIALHHYVGILRLVVIQENVSARRRTGMIRLHVIDGAEKRVLLAAQVVVLLDEVPHHLIVEEHRPLARRDDLADVFEIFVGKTLWCFGRRGAGSRRRFHAGLVCRHLAVPILRDAQQQRFIARGDLREIDGRGGEELGDERIDGLRVVRVGGELLGKFATLGGELRVLQRGESSPRCPDAVMPADARFQVIIPRPRPVRAQAAQLHEAVEGHLVGGLLLIVNRHQVFRRLPAPVGGEFALDLLAEAFQRRLARGELALEITMSRRLLRLDERRAFRWFTAAREDAVQRVVILRRHGIELVIVTTRAGEREAHGRLADQVDAVVDDVVLVVPETIAESKETHRRHLA